MHNADEQNRSIKITLCDKIKDLRWDAVSVLIDKLVADYWRFVFYLNIMYSCVTFILYFLDNDDEGIEHDSEDLDDDNVKCSETKELDHVLDVSI